MRRSMVAVLGLGLILTSGCAWNYASFGTWAAVPNTVPELPSFARAAVPTWMGSESSVDHAGSPDAHKWSEADARTALWYTRNFPDDTAAFLFAIHKLWSFNYRDDNHRRYDTTAQDKGFYASGLFHTRTDEVIALLWDPQLRVKMLSLQARDRTRLRERDRRRNTATWPYDVSSQPAVDTGDMSDREVEQRLLERYQ